MVQAALASMLGFGQVASREKSVSSHVPYLRHVDEQTLRTKDGLFVTSIKLDGFCFQTADQSEINQRLSTRNTLIRAMNDSRFAVYSHIIRREVRPEIGGSFENPFAAMIDRKYREGLHDKRMFVNDLFLTVIRRGFQGKIGFADNMARSFRKAAGVAVEDMDKEALGELAETTANLVNDLSSYGARVLKIVAREGAIYSEPCEFLGALLNAGHSSPMLLPRMGLDSYLPRMRVTFGRKSMEWRGASEEDTRFGAMVSIREYPAYSGPGMLDGLLRIPGEFIVSQSFAIQDRSPVLAQVAKVERQIAASDERGTEVERAIAIARDELVTGRTVLGNHHLTILAMGRTVRDMERCVQDATKELQNFGITTVREDMNAEPCFWAQLPGNFSYIARASMISSRNFVGFASLHNFAVGRGQDNRWGPAISLLQTTSQTPYYFNFHRRQVGNFTVVGPTGSGKTVALSFLMSQALRVSPTPRCAFFDKDRGAEVFIRALGGRYEALVPGEPTGFNPLQLAGSPGDRDFLQNLLRFLVRPRDGSDLAPEQEKIIEGAVEQIFLIPLRERRFDDVEHLLRGRERAGHGDLASRFAVWLNARGWLFNNDVDRWDAGNGIFGFDITGVLDDDDIRTAALGYIFHRVEGLMDGSPMMMFIDEGWRILNDEKFSSFVTDKLKTIRKLNGIVGFGTQSAKDIVASKMAHTLLEQSPTNLFFPNPKADDLSYREGFKLSARELAWLRETAPEARQFLIKHDQDSVIARLDLASMPDVIRILSGSPESAARCAALRARYGDAPEHWLSHFCEEA